MLRGRDRGVGGLPALSAALCVALALLSLAAPAPALAQSAPPPSVLTGVTGSQDDHGKTLAMLTFAPVAPKFQIIDNDTTHPAIAFALSSRATATTSPHLKQGLLSSVTFEQSDSVLIVHLTVTGVTHVEATPVGDRAISLALTPGQLAVPPPRRRRPRLGLPRSDNRDRPARTALRSCS